MPQIIVDTAAESPASLALVSRLLQDYAVLKAKHERQAETEYPNLDAAAQLLGLARPATQDSELEDPAKLFAANKPSNVLPFPNPTAAGTVNTAAPATSVPVAPIAGDAPIVASVPVAPVTAATDPDASTATAAQTAEVDKAGVPWDARIHSSAKGKKQDGTWKLMRGVDKSLVTMVLHEITPKPHVAGGVIVPPGTVAAVATPVAPPLAPSAPLVPPVPVPVAPAGPVAPAAGAVSVGTAALPLNPVQQFQAFMQQVTAAQAAGTLTQVAVLDAVKAEGVPQLQLLITNPDKIPLVKGRLGLV